MVEDAKEKGAKVLFGGKPHALGKTFYEPTLLSDIDPSMLCYQQEIFGPVAMTMRYGSIIIAKMLGIFLKLIDTQVQN